MMTVLFICSRVCAQLCMFGHVLMHVLMRVLMCVLMRVQIVMMVGDVRMHQPINLEIAAVQYTTFPVTKVCAQGVETTC